MKTKKPAASRSAGSLVLEITTDTTRVEGDARAFAAALLAFASSLRKARLLSNRKGVARAAALAKGTKKRAR